MKKICTAIALLMTCVATAQIVNIPDPAFKNELISYFPVIDINHDGEIQVSEALAITELNLYSPNDLTGIQSFTNLEILNTNSSPLTFLNLNNMLFLKRLNIQGNFTSINLNNCHKLEYLNLLDLHTPGLDLRSCDSLATIKFGIMGSGDIGTLNISGLTKLDSIYDFGSLGSLIAINCTGLKIIDNRGNPMDIRYLLDVTGCTNLKLIYLSSIGTGLTSLDLSSCSSLESLSIIYSTPNLQNLNIKNGREQTIYFVNGGVHVNPVMNVCADEFEIGSVTNSLSSTWGGISSPYIVNINSYCSFLPGGNYNTIKGKVRLDLNNNNCVNTNRTMSNVPIRITDTSGLSIVRFTDQVGDYVHYPFKGVFTLTPYFPYPYFNINPVTATVTYDTANSIISTRDFCISPSGTYNELDITLLPVMPARPGFEGSYQLTYRNRGTTTLSGTVQLNFDNSKMNFTGSNPIISSQTSGQLSWNYSNLAPFESRTINVIFNFQAPPVNNIGDTLIFLAVVNPVNGDQTPYDNSFILPQRVVGSFDPNDKQCLEGSKLAITAVDKYLHYLIRFQNMGTDTAFNIVVVDTLSNKLDWNTVELISSSHICDVQLNKGKLEFFFKDIKLPYKAINEPASNGFVAFKIKPKNTISIGDSLNNKAAIYFDYNLPVITNMASTIVTPVSPIPVKIEYFSGSKQQAKNLLTWKAPSTNGSTDFSIERCGDGVNFSSIGNITATYERCLLPFNFTDNNPLAGKNYYRLKITDVDRVMFYSKTVLLENNNRALDIISITGNNPNTTVYLNSAKQQSLQLRVIAADGRIIYMNNIMVAAGMSKIELPLNKMAKGIYTLITYTSDGSITKKFIH